jgi:SAM-dependent methyltransferase
MSRDTAGLDAVALRHLIGPTAGLDTRIHPADEMLLWAADEDGAARARFEYFRLGRDLAGTVQQITDWAFPGPRDELAVLEFASGYGRNLRHLVQLFDPARIVACDIDADAVAFDVQQFGVRGAVSTTAPEGLSIDERFDLVIVPSFFSHLPDATFGPWLRRLCSLLSDRGVLAFSVHGDHLMPGGDLPDGILFEPRSETAGRLDAEQYGTTWVSEDYVARQIEAASGRRRYGRIERGFWDFQDVYLVTGERQRDPATFSFRAGIVGHVDDVVLGSGSDLAIRGWARDAGSAAIAVRVLLGGQLLAEASPGAARPDVAHLRGPAYADVGFHLETRLPPGADHGQDLVVEARTDHDARCLYALPAALAQRPDGHAGQARGESGLARLLRRRRRRH